MLSASFSLAEQLYKTALRNKGATMWTRLTYTPTSGYIVAMQACELVVDLYEQDSDDTQETIATYVVDHYGMGDGIGLWLDEGKLYLDVVVYCNTGLESALAMGREQKQLAIFNIGKNEAIEVK